MASQLDAQRRHDADRFEEAEAALAAEMAALQEAEAAAQLEAQRRHDAEEAALTEAMQAAAVEVEAAVAAADVETEQETDSVR